MPDNAMLLRTGHGAQPWLPPPTLASETRPRHCIGGNWDVVRLCNRSRHPACCGLPPHHAGLLKSGSGVGRGGLGGRKQQVWAWRIRSGRSSGEPGQEDEDSEDEDPAYESVDYVFFMARKSFYQVCRSLTKCARGWLPPIISTQLISFTVGGVVLLSALWVFKAFLEVGCVAGTFAFVAIVAIRMIWSFIAYFGDSPVNGTPPDDKGRYRWSFSQPE